MVWNSDYINTTISQDSDFNISDPLMFEPSQTLALSSSAFNLWLLITLILLILIGIFLSSGISRHEYGAATRTSHRQELNDDGNDILIKIKTPYSTMDGFSPLRKSIHHLCWIPLGCSFTADDHDKMRAAAWAAHLDRNRLADVFGYKIGLDGKLRGINSNKVINSSANLYHMYFEFRVRP